MRRVEMESTYGKWTVISYKGSGKYVCRCACGVEKVVMGKNLRNGRSTACRTCGNSKPWTDIGKKFAHVPREVYNKLRRAISDAIKRCEDETHCCYPNWGGRGIRVLFADPIEFMDHLITLPGHDNLELVLDRIKNDGNYEPGNIRFSTYLESGRNQRHTPKRQQRSTSN